MQELRREERGMSKHAPGQLFWTKGGTDGYHITELRNGRGDVVCSFEGTAAIDCVGGKEPCEADAAEIVHRWNAYTDLLAALKAIRARISGMYDEPSFWSCGPCGPCGEKDILAMAEAAIDKAEGADNA